MDGEVAGNPSLHGSSLHSEEIYHQKTRGLGHGKAAYPRNKKGEFTMPNKVLSTGVLIRDPASFNANVTVVNTGATTGQTAKVEIFDWGVEQLWSKPTPVPVSPSTAVAIGAHTQQDFIALITQSTAQPTLNLVLYEIRITVPAKSPLIINCFAINAQDGIVAANTVLHAQLVAI
jgi:hypothetical protein